MDVLTCWCKFMGRWMDEWVKILVLASALAVNQCTFTKHRAYVGLNTFKGKRQKSLQEEATCKDKATRTQTHISINQGEGAL